mmetsp:Transcript_65040/g.188597  ORF Transcript_65040/g.188597 Transcript_65040/m.188597 type:complete len:239 (+) Transcript_65040:1920-2636(+)
MRSARSIRSDDPPAERCPEAGGAPAPDGEGHSASAAGDTADLNDTVDNDATGDPAAHHYDTGEAAELPRPSRRHRRQVLRPPPRRRGRRAGRFRPCAYAPAARTLSGALRPTAGLQGGGPARDKDQPPTELLAPKVRRVGAVSRRPHRRCLVQAQRTAAHRRAVGVARRQALRPLEGRRLRDPAAGPCPRPLEIGGLPSDLRADHRLRCLRMARHGRRHDRQLPPPRKRATLGVREQP